MINPQAFSPHPLPGLESARFRHAFLVSRIMRWRPIGPSYEGQFQSQSLAVLHSTHR